MTDDSLFDADFYGPATPLRHREAALGPTVEAHQPPWVLLANRLGVIGFHWPESVSEYNTTHALCGVKGHAVEPPETMVRCSECERLRLLP